MPEEKHILIVNPFGIGDVLFSTPLIRNLRFYYPDAFIAVAVQKKTAPLLENNPNINRVITFSRGDYKDLSRRSRLQALKLLLETIRQVQGLKLDICFDLSLEHRYSLLLKLLNVKQRIGYNYKKRGRFLTDKISIDGYSQEHVVDYHLQLLKFLGLKPREGNLELFLSQSQKDWARDFLDHNGIEKSDLLIGIAPFGGETFASQALIKHWPVENYAKLCDLLIERLKAKIIILSGPQEKAGLNHLLSLMHNKAVHTTEASIMQLAAVTAGCRLVISNDTGPLRFANALNVPSLSLFGPVDEKVYGPYPVSCCNTVLKKDFACRPCYLNFRVSECPYQRRCLTSIKIEEVFLEAENLLNKKNHE